jgi:hypothetical protein
MFSRLLCFIGIHRWDTATSTHDEFVYTYMRCWRTPSCRYAKWQLVNIEERS